MAYRIAFASNDGKEVNQHFGRAKKFFIFEIDDNSAEYIEIRESKPPSYGYEYTEKAMNRAIEVISDCKAIFVTHIGYGALVLLKRKDIAAYETSYYISEIIGRILSSEIQI